MVDYVALNMMHSLGFMMLIGGALLLLTTKSPSPSPSNTSSASYTSYAQNALGWPRIGYYALLIGAVLIIFTSFITIILVDYIALSIIHSLGCIMLAGGALLLFTTKSPSPSDASDALDWPSIGYYSALIGIALVIFSGLIA